MSDTITSTIQKAQAKLSRDLESSLELATCEDRVVLNLDLFAGVTQNNYLKVKLTNLFVDPTTVKVMASSGLGVVGERVKPLLINPAQGELFFPVSMDGSYLTITYESGLDQTTIPDDIRQSLLLYTSLIFAANQPNTDDSAPPKTVNSLAGAAVDSYKKVSAFSFRPFMHTQEAQ